ncbi:MAG TPA: hypothetical protein VHM48_12865 [Candidatus Limnocylindrales bacterium]|nr:hypothetical protein [Candidatus Limnocylindrales bacterium]
MIELFRTCRRHRAALVDFVDHGLIGPPTAAALAHLDRCDACTEMLDSTVLAIAALRRLGEEAARVEPRTDAWPRLRARLSTRRPSRLSIVSPLAGVFTSVALAALLVAPIHLGGGSETERIGGAAGASDRTSSPTTAAYSSSARRGTDGSNSPDPSKSRAGIQPKLIYPDGGRPLEKEVPSARSIVRPAEPR